MANQTTDTTSGASSTKPASGKPGAATRSGQSRALGAKARRYRSKANEKSAAKKVAGDDSKKSSQRRTSKAQQAALAKNVEKLQQSKREMSRLDEEKRQKAAAAEQTQPTTAPQPKPKATAAPVPAQPAVAPGKPKKPANAKPAAKAEHSKKTAPAKKAPASAKAKEATPVKDSAATKETKPAEDAARSEEKAGAKETAPAKKATAAEPAKKTKPPTAEVAEKAEESESEPSRGKRKGDRKRGADASKRATRGGDRSRRTGRRLTVTEALTQGDAEVRQRSLAAMRRRVERDRRMRRKSAGIEVKREKVIRDVQIPDAIRLQDLANRMAEPSSEVIKRLMAGGQVATLNDLLDADTAELLVQEFGHRAVRVSASDVEIGIAGEADAPEALQPRAPVITVMGHVDHGKTSLLDKIRETSVAQGEAGEITQHIGAYRVETANGDITFIDTPGHAAFGAMRARGAKVTDVVILVVAANDGVMPQTAEAIEHAQAAGVPIVVAINKIDLEDASGDRVRDALLEKGVIVEARGGEVQDVEVSAKTGHGIENLLEAVLLQASLLDLKANPNRRAEGTVIEAKVDKGRGNVATVLISRGTLRPGEVFVVGSQWGRARALRDERDRQLQEAGPSVPVEIDGLQGLPEAGDPFTVVEAEASARDIAEYRADNTKQARQTPTMRAGFEQLAAAASAQQQQELPVIIKADVRGSTEAIVNAVGGIGNEDVSVVVRGSGVGAITESDITLAAAVGARVFGFNVRPNSQAKKAAAQYDVPVSFHSVIYELLDEVKSMASGLLAPEIREHPLGAAEILQVFRIKKVGAIAGCNVTEGFARKDAKIRLVRDGTVMFESQIVTLKRVKDDVPEVRAGTECGMSFRNQQDMRVGDIIEIFETEEVERTL